MRIITKNTQIPGKIPTTEDLLIGELAVNTADGRIYVKHDETTIRSCNVAPYPDTPIIMSPDGTGITLIPTIVTSAYVIAADDPHLYSQYQIATDITFNNIVYDSGVIATSLTSLTINTRLQQNTWYYIRAKHCASIGGQSFQSLPKHIKTTNVIISAPTLSTVGEPNNISLVPTLVGSTFDFTGDADSFYSADQILMYDTTTLFSSIDNTTDGTSFKYPWGYMEILTSYTFKVRYQGTSRVYSPYTTVSYTTEDKSVYLTIPQGTTPFLAIYYQDYDTLHRLSDSHIIGSIPTTAAWSSAFTTDGQYLALGCSGTTSINFMKRNKNIFTYMGTVATQPGTGGVPYEIDYSSDDVYLASSYSTSPYIGIYKREGETYTKLTNPTTLPTGAVQYLKQSPDTNYLATGHSTSPYASIYKRTGDTFAKLTPSSNPPGQIYGLCQSDDSVWLVYTFIASPYVAIYKRSGDTFTKQANPATLPNGACSSCAFSHDGTLLILTSNAGGLAPSVYSVSGDTFTKLSNSITQYPSTGNSGSILFSKDDQYLYIKNPDTTTPLQIYKRNGNTFTKLANPETLPTTQAGKMAIYPKVNTP